MSIENREIIETAAYIVAAVLFIVGLKRLSSPATARSGNMMGAFGMLLAIVVTLVVKDIVEWPWIIAGLVAGSAVGLVMARFVQMTAMPQMVAVFNGFGGGASTVVAAAALFRENRLIGDAIAAGGDPGFDTILAVSIMASAIIGAVTFTGSMIAFGKLQGFVSSRPVLLPGRNILNALLVLGTLALAGWLIGVPDTIIVFAVMIGLALIVGVLVVIPIGGADMPVVIALLNSYSGIAAAATGFVLQNNALIIAGSLVGASGIILTRIMCKAMNRSIANVILGGFGAVDSGDAGTIGQRPVRSVGAEDAAMVLGYARSVVFVPGYGLAVAQAQHNVRELADLLQARGADVKYAVHPVAGRMPGHMNVLLAEANVPYDQLHDLEINSEFPRTDVAIVIGANDVTNSAARNDKTSPIYGMPILDVDKAKSVIVIKRSLSPGFAGIDNDLFYMENTMMFFADAKKAVAELVAAVKEL